MKTFFYLVILISLIACNSRDPIYPTCLYSIDSIFKYYDTSRFLVKNFKEKGVIDIIENKSKTGEGGIYTFDENNALRFYGFLINDSNKYDFSIQYDSIGNEITSTGSTIVQGYFRKYKSDSLKMTFLLYALHNAYSNIRINVDGNIINCDELYKSDIFSNLIGNTINIPFIDQSKERWIYISGIRINTCSLKEKNFIDSTLIPSGL